MAELIAPSISEQVIDERDVLNRIGVALSSTRDVAALLEMILAKAREITYADAGSLYLLEECNSPSNPSEPTERQLRFKLTQNDTRQFPFTERTLPITEDSMAGYCALHGEVVVLEDVYKIAVDRPYHFNPSYDQRTKYRTRSMLTVPMKNARGDVLGVMQLLNRKRSRDARLLTEADVDREVESFPQSSIRLAESLASQAAVAYENSVLYDSIQTLFDGFVKAAVTAIEQRDPTTSGHSLRVASMTIKLAEAVNSATTGPYANFYFTPNQLKELRYAALLHDFGKIAVREDVLTKARRLYPAQLAIIQQRFEYLHEQVDVQRAERKLAAATAQQNRDTTALDAIDDEYDAKHKQLDGWLQLVTEVNGLGRISAEQAQQLAAIGEGTYIDRGGVIRPVLTNGEIESLSIRQGSLNNDERREIESHVMHSFDFLTQIPWTPELRYIPWIVRAHHEKANGRGYPLGLSGDEIPLQAKIMMVCDIFDALCAADRPYKKAMPFERAFEVLRDAAAKNEIDQGLLRLFIDARIFDVLQPATVPPAESKE